MLPVLVLLLVLGHVCELSAYAELLSDPGVAGGHPGAVDHAAGGHHGTAAHRAADGQDSEHDLSCDVLDATSSPDAPRGAPALEIAAVVLGAQDEAIGGLDAAPLPAPPRLARPPLFLLHASLLI
jgi:hypothetical protein